jgi:F-type H+-transporting ATPase subunit delta
MRQNKVRRRYAKALFDLSLEMKRVEEVYKDMQYIMDLSLEVPEFRILMKSPIIRPDKKIKIFDAIIPPSFQELTVKFIHLIVNKNRELFVDQIADEFFELYKEHKNIKTVHLQSAVGLSEENRKNIIEIIASQLNAQIDLVEDVDEELIGGFVLKTGDRIFDSSISRKLENLKKEFSVNIYKKGF